MQTNDNITKKERLDLRPNQSLLICGPCSAETRDQVLETAYALASLGISYFRAGIWKPRTRPGCFEGVGEPGLKWLREVKRSTGMQVATEVGCRRHVEASIDNDIDILWIGARTTCSPFAVDEIAETVAALDPERPVLIKNPIGIDVNLWVGAIERLQNAGIRNIAAIYRGEADISDSVYRNPPHWEIPFRLREIFPDLQIIIDPSHIAGKRELVADIVGQARLRGYASFMAEAHINPRKAWTDSQQQLTPRQICETFFSSFQDAEYERKIYLNMKEL